MPSRKINKAPNSFGIMVFILLVWNLIGAMIFVLQVTMSPADVAALPYEHRLLHQAIPQWATAAHAIAVFGGVLGCLLLLMRKAMAILFLQLSLVGVIVHMFYFFIFSTASKVMDEGDTIMIIAVLIIALHLVALAYKAEHSKWIT
jgi:hypothetical protein